MRAPLLREALADFLGLDGALRLQLSALGALQADNDLYGRFERFGFRTCGRRGSRRHAAL
jgi:hypothetical protein